MKSRFEASKLPRNTLIGSSFMFLFGCFLYVKAVPNIFPDSTRYLLTTAYKTSIWDELTLHTGRNFQTLLFSLAEKSSLKFGYGSVVFNLLIWFLTASILMCVLERNLDSRISKSVYIAFVVAIYTSTIVASWLTAVLSESIALSFLIPIVVISTLVILGSLKVENVKYSLLIFNFFLYMSQPIWAILVLPMTLFAYSNLRKFKFQLLSLAALFISTTAISATAHNLPYEDTGLSYKGWDSLTRAYFFSLEDRFETPALGDSIKNCPAAFQLLKEAQAQGTPTPLFFGFKAATTTCPEVIEEFNRGKSNSVFKMVTNDVRNSIRMTVIGLFAISNQQIYSGDAISGRPISAIFSNMLNPFGLFLLPACFLLIDDNRKRLKINLNSFLVLFGGLLLYFQVGIEGERHSLPASIVIGIQCLLVLIFKFVQNQKISEFYKR